MFARRSTWDLRPNRLARRVEQLRKEGRPFLDLTVSNPTRAGLGPSAELLAALARHPPAAYAPRALGLPAARRAVAAYYAGRNIPVRPHQVVLTASTSEAYGYLFKLLADPGDNVLMPRPGYPLFEYLAGLEGVSTRSYPLRYTGSRWEVDVDRLSAAVDGRTRAIVLVSPHNPAGAYLQGGERRMLEELARECGLALIVDEVFADYVLDPRAAPPLSCASGAEVLTFTLSGLSKVLGAPQFKLSWMVADGPPGRVREAMDRLEVIADTYLSVATQVQQALPELLALRVHAQGPILQRLRTNLACLQSVCRAAAPGSGRVRALPVEGGWYAVLRVEGDEEERVLSLLEEAAVWVHPGYFFDFPTHGHLVLSLLAADLCEGMGRIVEHVAGG